jgi:plastocyanin
MNVRFPVWIGAALVVAAGLSAGAYVAVRCGTYITLRDSGTSSVEGPLAGSGDARSVVGGVVRMTPQGYVPGTVQVERGEAVRFENAGSGDQWPQSDVLKVSAPGIVPAGQSWVVAFSEAGTYRYVDRVYPNLQFQVEVR